MADRNLFIGNAPERMEINFSRKKQFTMFFLGLLLAAGCGFAAYASGPEYINVKLMVMRFSMPAIYFKSLMVFGACFFSLLPIMMVIKAIKKVPLAVLDAEGIKLSSLKGPTIKWNDVTSYECYTLHSHEFMGFNVKDPSIYLNNLSSFKRSLINLNRKSRFSDFSFMISKEDKQALLHMFHNHVGG